MTHTPGPWRIDDIQVEDWRVNISSPESNIACAYHQTDDPSNADDECLANARLIAAAPELYAALVECLTMNDKGGNTREDFDRWERKARAAIAKAEG